MRRFFISIVGALLVVSAGNSQTGAGTNNSVHAGAGKSLLPVPQKVSLSDARHPLDNTWRLETSGNIAAGDSAVVTLTSALRERFGVRLRTSGGIGDAGIQLTVNPGSVAIGQATDRNRGALEQQAYRLTLAAGRIAITANAAPGLFYGVQSLVQLLQPENEKTYFPGGEIIDWPDLDLRMIYWDDAHHLERLDAMKRAIRQASHYKINGFALKLEGHFQFKSAKPLVEPYAYTPAEYQELTDYARAHHVELVPYLDAPAHVSFILKHPEYAALRALPGSNYELSVIDPKADELILGMFNDLMEANRGGKYIFLSTDEAYYVGKVESERSRAEALGGNGRLLAEYITRIGNQLHEKGRQVIAWVELPLTASDLDALPSHLINAMYNDEWAPKLKERGIRQLVYTSITGQQLFPNYHKMPPRRVVRGGARLPLTDDEQQRGSANKGRIEQGLERINAALASGKADFMGVVVAGWADRGLHPETFWLGYASVTAAAWNRAPSPAQELMDRFYHSFYGPRSQRMDEVYRLLSNQAEFWNTSWEWIESKHRTPIIGSSAGIFDSPRPAKEQSLPALPVPTVAGLSLNLDWHSQNRERLTAAEKSLRENAELMELLQENLIKVEHRSYNIQVLRSVAQVCRQNANMLLDLKRIVDFMSLAARVAGTNPSVAVGLLDQALDQAQRIRTERNDMLQAVTAIWYQDWYPRVAEANGRRYLDQVDDVKDHEPVRTVDMSYLIYRQLKFPFGQWAREVSDTRNRFAREHGLPGRSESLDWEDY